MKPELRDILTDKFGKAVTKKKMKQMQVLDQQASFTLRKWRGPAVNSTATGSPSDSQLLMPQNSGVTGSEILLIDDNDNGDCELQSVNGAWVNQSKQGFLYAKFIVFLAVSAYLIDDFTFAYQISSTCFDSIIEGSVFFSGNILRIKSLAAEQIFKRYYYNANDNE